MDASPYVAQLRRRAYAARAARRERAQRVVDRLPHAVDVLRREFGVHRVVLFGSLTRGELTPHSDVDLAVSGLRKQDSWRALDRVGDVLGVDVDLVPIDEAPEVLRDRIDRDGVVLLDG